MTRGMQPFDIHFEYNYQEDSAYVVLSDNRRHGDGNHAYASPIRRVHPEAQLREIGSALIELGRMLHGAPSARMKAPEPGRMGTAANAATMQDMIDSKQIMEMMRVATGIPDEYLSESLFRDPPKPPKPQPKFSKYQPPATTNALKPVK